MSEPIVTLDPLELSVEPGGQVRTEVTVRNPGTVVEGYRVEVLGETADQGPPKWAQVFPPELRVYPKESGTAMIVFAPPSVGEAASGKFAFGVRVVSTVETERSAVAEGDLEVGRVFGLQATITPVTSSGRWRGYHLVKYTNWGNTPVRLRLKATDPDERLGFLLRPDVVDLPLGASAEARLTVRTRKPFLRGQQVRLPFEVVGEQDGVAPVRTAHPMVSDPRRPVVNGAMMQRPIIGKGVVMLALICVGVLVGAVVLALKAPQKKQTFESEGLPSPPTLTAATVKDGAIQLNWHPAQEVSGYKVHVLQGATELPSAKIDNGQQGRFLTTALGLAPATRYCFRLDSLRGTKESKDSNKVCQKTPPAPKPSGSGSPGGSSPGTTSSPGGGSPGGSSPGGGASGTSGSSGVPTSGSTSPSDSATGPAPPSIALGQWILLCRPLHYDSDPNAQQEAQADATHLDFFVAAQVLHSSDYPVFYVDRVKTDTPFWAVFFGPYGSSSEGDSTNRVLAANGVTCIYQKPLGG